MSRGLNFGVWAAVFGFAAGCAMFPTERSRSQSSGGSEVAQSQLAATVQRVSEGQPAATPVITVSGESNTVALTVESPPVRETVGVNGAASGDATWTWDFSDSRAVEIPLGVKLILLAVGGLLVIGVVSLLLRKVSSLRAGLKMADARLARRIHEMEARASATVSREEQAFYNEFRAGLESDRGRVHGAI